MINRVIDYFDLRPGTGGPAAQAAGGASIVGMAAQYLTLVAGIVVQPFFAKFQENGVWEFTNFAGWFLFALIVGVLVFPAVYKNAFDPDKPVFVQLCAIFAGGIGWQSLLSTAGTATGITPAS